MAFYFKPPRGNISLHRLRECIEQRIKLLSSLDKFKTGEEIHFNIEYLMEGTALDRTGHFVLRLIALSSLEFQDFFISSERDLFELRLNHLKVKEFLLLARTVIRHANESLNKLPQVSDKKIHEFLQTLTYVLQEIALLANHMFNALHSEDCTSHYVTIPFTMCLSFIHKREVNLRSGQALIPCGKWKKLLVLLFEKHLKAGMKELTKTNCFQKSIDDPRIEALAREVGARFKRKDHKSLTEEIQACDVDRESSFFPPCMAHLHRELRVKHRLTHESRRLYTLFLKDIGMPVGEAIKFWEEEYSKPHSHNHGGCTHSWQENVRKYTYGIRHMYGLEGGRYNYKGPSCVGIQETILGPLSESGCPFKHFDDDKLRRCLSLDVLSEPSTMDTIHRLRNEFKASEACCIYTSMYKLVLSSSRDLSSRDCSFRFFATPLNVYSFLKVV